MRKTIRSLIRQRPRSIQSKSFFNKSSLLFQHHNISTKTSIPWQQALRRNHQLLKKNNTKTRTFTTATKPVRNNSSSRVSRNTMDSLEDQLPQLETALQRVMKLQNEDRTKVISGGLLIIALSVYIYGDMIVQGVSGGVAEVTGSEAVTTQVELLAKAVVTTVLNDDQVLQKATEFVTALSANPGTQQALVQLLLVALRHKDTQQELYRLSQLIVGNVLSNPQTTQQVVQLVQRVLADPNTQANVIVLFSQLLENPTTRVAMASLTTATLKEEYVQQQVNDIAANSVHYTLNDPAVFEHATQFVSGVLSEKDVQKSSGEHLWNAFTYSITPTLFGVQSGTSTTAPTAPPTVPPTVPPTAPITPTTTTTPMKKIDASSKNGPE